MDDPRVCEKTLAGFQANTAAWPAKTVLYLSIGVPAFTLTCNLFMSSETSFYLLADCPDRLEKLFELEALRSATVTGWAAQAGADVILGAINGLELYSPDIYRRYFIPQARTLYETAHRLGLRAWTHTCGRMNRLIEEDTYRQMGPDILESLSHAPLGDVDDLRRARQKLGPDIVTRGAVNVSLFYDRNLMYIRERTQTVLAETRGFRHMIGDTNDSFPPYPKENLLALIDEVEKSGRMLRLE